MRPDFKKLLCERPRAFGHKSDKIKGVKRARQEDENRPYEDWTPGGKVSMKKTYGGRSRRTKYLNENLSPLKNFLVKNVGRKWDEVYSEINEACPNDSAVNAHIYQHLFSYVELHPIIQNGVIYKAYHNQIGGYGKIELEGSENWPQFFVNDQGILLRAPNRPSKNSIKKKDLQKRMSFERRLFKDKWAVKIEKVWYWAHLKSIPPIPYVKKVVQHVGGDGEPYTTEHMVPSHGHYFSDAYMTRQDASKIDKPHYFNTYAGFSSYEILFYKKYYGDAVYCHRLEQMNSSEIRKLKLKNS